MWTLLISLQTNVFNISPPQLSFNSQTIVSYLFCKCNPTLNCSTQCPRTVNVHSIRVLTPLSGNNVNLLNRPFFSIQWIPSRHWNLFVWLASSVTKFLQSTNLNWFSCNFFRPDRMNGLSTGKLNKPIENQNWFAWSCAMFEVHLKARFFVLNKLIRNRWFYTYCVRLSSMISDQISLTAQIQYIYTNSMNIKHRTLNIGRWTLNSEQYTQYTQWYNNLNVQTSFTQFSVDSIELTSK